MSDDDDYELPSLTERIQASLKFRNTLQVALMSESEAEENEFQKDLTGNHSTPYCETKLKPVLFLSDSEEDYESEFLKCSEKIHSTPYSKKRQVNHDVKESDSDEAFSSIIENICKSQTPMAKNKQVNHDVNESDSDEAFSSIIENTSRIQSPVTKAASHGISGSDSDESFSNIIENMDKFRTPVTLNKHVHYNENESDSDGTFSKITENLSKIYTPKSQNKKNRDFISPVFERKEILTASSKEDTTESSSLKAINEKEYAILFPSKPVHLSSKDQTVYGQKLYQFFNAKIFSSELPADMPLIWSSSLVSAAGKTFCSCKKGTRSCFIKLSSKLLISFDRLQDTLLHEMCHAAVWLISKGNEHHGPLWKIWAWRCKAILPFVECPERCHDYDIPYRVWYQCLKCHWKIGRSRQSKQLQNSVCRKCKVPIVMTTK